MKEVPEADYTDADADAAPPMYESESESEAGEDEESDSDMSDSEEKKAISTELRVPAAPASSSKRSSSSATPSGEGLSRHWKKTNTTGKGVATIEKIAYLFDEQDAKQNSDRVGFLQVRLVGPQKPKLPRKQKVQRKKDGDKNLSFASCSPEIQKGLLNSRYEEWKKFEKYLDRAFDGIEIQ